MKSSELKNVIKTKEHAEKFLSDNKYGERRDYVKIYVNGLSTTWAKNLTFAKVAYFAAYGEWPHTCKYAE